MGEEYALFLWFCNGIELWGSLRKHTHGVSKKTLEAARHASAHLNHFSHLLQTLHPRVVLITVKSLNCQEFFKGLKLVEVKSPDQHIRHYTIEGHEVDIFHTYHPGYMRRIGGPWHFLNQLRKTLEEAGLAPKFPKFITKNDEAEKIVRHLIKANPHKPDGSNETKYRFIAWVAEELTKHGSFMSVPQLVEMANTIGYRTNADTTYRGGRGSYRLVRGAYNRHQDSNIAGKIADAFRKPDFTYAY